MKKTSLLILFIVMLVGCSSKGVSFEVYNDTRQLHRELNTNFLLNKELSAEQEILFQKYEEQYANVSGDEKAIVDSLLNTKNYYLLTLSDEPKLESEAIEYITSFSDSNSETYSLLDEARESLGIEKE